MRKQFINNTVIKVKKEKIKREKMFYFVRSLKNCLFYNQNLIMLYEIRNKKGHLFL